MLPYNCSCRMGQITRIESAGREEAMGSNPGAIGGGSSLRDRLAAMQGVRPVAPAPPPVAQPPAAPVSLPDGREEETPFGPCYVVERAFPLDHYHGPHPLAALHGIEQA